MLRLLQRLIKKWTGRPRWNARVIIAGGDGPRDLDNPLSDPKVQARVGKTIAELAARRRGSKTKIPFE